MFLYPLEITLIMKLFFPVMMKNMVDRIVLSI